MNSISNVETGYKSEFYCEGCRYLQEEKFPKDRTALICGNESESGCKSRVLGVYFDSFLPIAKQYQLKPAWCFGGKYIPEEAEK